MTTKPKAERKQYWTTDGMSFGEKLKVAWMALTGETMELKTLERIRFIEFPKIKISL